MTDVSKPLQLAVDRAHDGEIVVPFVCSSDR